MYSFLLLFKTLQPQINEARSKTRNSLKVVGASRHLLGNRGVQLATFLDTCVEEEAALELQVGGLLLSHVYEVIMLVLLGLSDLYE